MELLAVLPKYLVLALLLSLSPGAGLALVLRRAAAGGFRGAVPVVLGLEAGGYLWAVMIGAGLAAIIAASATALTFIRFGGATVLILLGIRAWVMVWRQRATAPGTEASLGSLPPRGRSFTEALLVQLTNPAVAIGAIAIYPQFVPAGYPFFGTVLVLVTVHVIVDMSLYFTMAAALERASRFLRKPKVQWWIEVCTGFVLIGLGAQIVLAGV